MTGAAAGCALAPWDSAFFGLRIGRLTLERPSAGDVERAVAWADREGLHCLYALVDAGHPPSLRALEQARFDLMDIRLTLDRAVGDAVPEADVPIDVPAAADVEALKALARVSHPHTRFGRDARFDAGRAAELYAAWIEKAFAEDDAIVLVPRDAGRPGGYLTLHGIGGPEAAIGLIAVAQPNQGRGIGRALLAEGLSRLQGAGAERVTVVTQGANPQAVRFYETYGFRARSCQLWYHKWFDR